MTIFSFVVRNRDQMAIPFGNLVAPYQIECNGCTGILAIGGIVQGRRFVIPIWDAADPGKLAIEGSCAVQCRLIDLNATLPGQD